jgi:hypothetical protein
MFRGGRGHQVVFVCGEDAFDEFALVGMARDNGEFARFGRLKSFFTNVQAQIRFASFIIGAVAFETNARKNRPHISLEINIGGADGDGSERDRKFRKDGLHTGNWMNHFMRHSAGQQAAMQAASKQFRGWGAISSNFF